MITVTLQDLARMDAMTLLTVIRHCGVDIPPMKAPTLQQTRQLWMQLRTRQWSSIDQWRRSDGGGMLVVWYEEPGWPQKWHHTEYYATEDEELLARLRCLAWAVSHTPAISPEARMTQKGEDTYDQAVVCRTRGGGATNL